MAWSMPILNMLGSFGNEGNAMNVWSRMTLVLMIGSFPFAIYYFSTLSAAPQKKKRAASLTARIEDKSIDIAVSEMNRGVEAKAKELREIEVKILQNKGSILKLEEDRRAYVNNLESIQSQISEVIKSARSRATPK